MEGAPERLLELWDPEGTFEFAGSPPVTGTFTGINAISVLYRNRFAASGMPLRLQGNGKEDSEDGIEDALGVAPGPVSGVECVTVELACVADVVLANETIEGMPGNLTTVTGAGHPVILGKIVPGRNYLGVRLK